jgi:Phosphate-selective porin O and P
MIGRCMRFGLHCAALLLCLAACRVHAEPYLAVQLGLKCAQCHVNPTGGGLRTTFGDIFAQTVLPAQHLDTAMDNWTGQLGPYLRTGGDLRFDAQTTQAPHTASLQEFSLEQTRVYLEAEVIPNRLLAYADEQVAPGGALNREAYVLYWSATHDWYLKAGQMYLPFGLRLQDQTAFILTATGINMTTPDQGVEFGWERGHWDAQIAVSNGTAGGAVSSDGKQYSTQLIYVESVWRVGIAANRNDQSAGAKTAYGVFGGLRTGPISWLAQAEITDDESIAAGQGRQLATLLEANWLITRGHNLKITDEFLNPNRAVPNGEETRWSLVYEFTPIQFAQIRAGFRWNDGIPQDDAEHGRLYFLELHGYF